MGANDHFTSRHEEQSMSNISWRKPERHPSSAETAVETIRVISEDELNSITGAGGGYNGMVMDDTAGKEGIRRRNAYDVGLPAVGGAETYQGSHLLYQDLFVPS
jgi:hypothetical protein